MAGLFGDMDDSIEIDPSVQAAPTPKKAPSAKRSVKGYSLTKEDHEYLTAQAIALSAEQGKRVSASQFLSDLIAQERNK